MKAMILAAGFGKRMKEVTKKLPKSLISIGGKTLLERTIENLVTFELKIVINVIEFELIMSQIGDGTKYGAKIHWSEEVHPLETGGGIYKALIFWVISLLSQSMVIFGLNLRPLNCY